MALAARLLTALLVLFLLVVVLAAGVWHLAYGTTPGYSGEVGLAGLGAPVTITVDEAGVPTVAAETEADLFAGLGYVHALQRAWPMALWRQLATGAMSQWREDSTALALDRYARTLGFGQLARATYENLPEEEQALLDAYALGVNRAFEANRLDEGDEFVLQDVRPEAWAPWDALAVERLVAYLMAPPPAVPADSSARAAFARSPQLRRFLAADSLFRAMLHLDGAEHSLAFAVRDEAGAALVQRHVYGSSALPLVREAVLQRGGQTATVATVPGTLMLPGGFADRHGWSVLLTSTAGLVLAPAQPPAPSYDRVVTASGRETLVTAHRAGGTLFIEVPARPAQPADTTAAPAAPVAWQLRWRGLAPGTDLAAWRALLRGEAPAFALFDGHGLTVAADGTVAVLGAPAVVRQLPAGALVGGHPLARFAADRLAARLADSTEAVPADLATDAFSPWAARLAPPLIAALGAPGEVEGEFRDAAAFLRGWDFHYRPASIGASIFEAWMDAYRDALGDLPNPDTLRLQMLPPTDTLQTGPVEPDDLRLLKQTLRLALARLRDGFGPGGASWRWEHVQGAVARFPLWDDLDVNDGTARFAPALIPDGGHPTALAWGPSLLFPDAGATAVWTAWGHVPADGAATVRHRDLHTRGFLASYSARTEPLAPRPVGPTRGSDRQLRLVPEG